MNYQLGGVTFKPIDLNTDGQVCLRFSEDAYVESFGDADRFYEKDGKGADRYLIWLKEKAEKDPLSCVHVWFDSEIIGQMVLGRFKFDPEIGYVNLYYLIRERRGSGLSRYLDEYACRYLKGLGLSVARLSVSPTNGRAVAYYKKVGWRNIGPRPDHPEVHFMEKEI